MIVSSSSPLPFTLILRSFCIACMEFLSRIIVLLPLHTWNFENNEQSPFKWWKKLELMMESLRYTWQRNLFRLLIHGGKQLEHFVLVPWCQSQYIVNKFPNLTIFNVCVYICININTWRHSWIRVETVYSCVLCYTSFSNSELFQHLLHVESLLWLLFKVVFLFKLLLSFRRASILIFFSFWLCLFSWFLEKNSLSLSKIETLVMLHFQGSHQNIFKHFLADLIFSNTIDQIIFI